MVLEVHPRVAAAKSAVRNLAMLEIVERRREQGLPVFYLNIGDPAIYGLKPALSYRLAKARAAFRGRTYTYAEAHGIKELREAVAADARKHGILDANHENVVVGQGASEIVDFLSALSLGQGKNIVVPKPDYYLYSSLARKYGGEVRYYDLEPGEKWQPNLEQIKQGVDDNTAAVVLINPNNPTGAAYSQETLLKFIRTVREAGNGNVPIVADEVYRHLVFPKKKKSLFEGAGTEHVSLASLTTDLPVITVDGVSKGYYAPGDRIGHALFSNFRDTKWRDAMKSLCAARLAAPHEAQIAYARAIRTRDRWWNRPAYNRRLNEIAERTKYASGRLAKMGFKVQEAQGAFYLTPQMNDKMRQIWKTDVDFARELLYETGVYVVPASGFAMNPNEGFFRVVSLPPVKQQKKIFDIMQKHIEQRTQRQIVGR